LITFFRHRRWGYAEESLSLMPGKGKIVASASPWKLLSWTAVLGVLFGLVGFGEIAEDWLRVARNGTHSHKASGDIVLVDVDDPSLRQIGRLPWPRARYGELVDKLTQAGAKRIFIDMMMDGASDTANDRRFADALQQSGRVILPAVSRLGPTSGSRQVDRVPHPSFAEHVKVGSVTVRYNYQTAVWSLPYGERIEGRLTPSYATLLANKAPSAGYFIPDYSLDPASIPRLPIKNIFNGSFDPRQVKGKDVVVGVTSQAGSDIYFVPGTGRMGGAYVHIIGAESLKAGTPVALGWLPLFVASLLVALVALTRRNLTHQTLLLIGGIVALVAGPAPLEARLIYLDVTPALFVLLLVGGVVAWRRYNLQGLINPVSSFPNLSAFRADRKGRDAAVIAARVINFEEILATLPPNSERQLVEQIVARINIGANERTIYQGDGGIFAWFDESKRSFGNHLEALSALFRTPARVAGLSLDLSISFGVEVGSSRSLASRLASALVAADEAAHDGLKWKYYDPETFADASWRLSMLSQLDDAIDKGQVWVAFQPKLDLATRKIVGAEALARWTHPEKGPIAATEFVAAAEQSNRIAKLTDFVLEKSVAAAAELNRRGPAFGIAVNLSARLLADKGFTLRLAALLARHKLDPGRLTLELTETAALAGSGEGIEMLARLREIGVRISIDDYGTGLSTLDYLKRIPANEIKIDQSFVKGIVDNRSDRLMVQSTIGLAHSLGRLVVAEGVEHREIIDILVELNCDIAQGFAIGRPMSLESLGRRVASERKRTAA
jgi:EAL domain-containing protein (putative c-di-GMP-specific phosphodiesterase class I)/CHASE2 domain-containing sensor protein